MTNVNSGLESETISTNWSSLKGGYSMFLVALVCLFFLSVCKQHYSNIYEQIAMKSNKRVYIYTSKMHWFENMANDNG